MPAMTLYGFDGSTFVRTVKMLLAEKGFSDYEQVPVDVLKGEPKQPGHLARHPFGKVPVLEHDGMTIIETSAITRYLNDVLPGRSLVPQGPKDRARMDEVIGVLESYGYGALIGGVAAYHLFPEFVGGKDKEAHDKGRETGRRVLDYAMGVRGGSAFLAGDLSLADLYLAPIVQYVSMTPDAEALFAAEGFAQWWDAIQALPSYASTRLG